jgi:hypothetical protein
MEVRFGEAHDSLAEGMEELAFQSREQHYQGQETAVHQLQRRESEHSKQIADIATEQATIQGSLNTLSSRLDQLQLR